MNPRFMQWAETTAEEIGVELTKEQLESLALCITVMYNRGADERQQDIVERIQS